MLDKFDYLISSLGKEGVELIKFAQLTHDLKTVIGFSINFSNKLIIIVMNDGYIKIIKSRLVFDFYSKLDILIKIIDEG